MTDLSSSRVKKPGLVSKSYRMSTPGLGCKMARGFTTTSWDNKDNTFSVGIFLGMKPSKLRVRRKSSLWPGSVHLDLGLQMQR